MVYKVKFLVCALLLTLYGCGSYYMVRDPGSGATYYTTDVDRTGDAGAIKFKDKASSSMVTIQQSDVRKISEDEYEDGIKRVK